MHAIRKDSVSLIAVAEHEEGQRLDNYLIKILKGVPKSHIHRIIRAGEVRLNKKRCKPDNRIQAGDTVRIPPIRIAEKQSRLKARPRLRASLTSFTKTMRFWSSTNRPALPSTAVAA